MKPALLVGTAAAAGLVLLTPPNAAGQEPGPAPAAPGVAAPAPAPDPELEALKLELQAQRAELEEQKQRLAASEARAEDAAALAALDASAVEPTADDDPLQFYGFFDTGFSKTWADDDSAMGWAWPAQGPWGSFFMGNLNLFLDATPAERWRFLGEVRFTTLPHGTDAAFGSPSGSYERNDESEYDVTSASGAQRVILGSTIVERAWAQWSASDLLRLRAGYLLTPFGIWNIDHGTPTLISLVLPVSQNSEYFPNHVTGLEALGTVEGESLELGYHAHISNGRTPAQEAIGNYPAFGGRVYGRTVGKTALTLGASGYYGSLDDEVKNITSFQPFRVERTETVEGREWAAGADVALDAGALRVRSEGVLHRVDYDEGQRPTLNGGFEPDAYEWDVYALVAYRLPAGIEPYVWFEVRHGPSSTADTVYVPSVGLNLHFSPSVQLKSQLTHVMFRDEVTEHAEDPAKNDATVLASRLVVSF